MSGESSGRLRVALLGVQQSPSVGVLALDALAGAALRSAIVRDRVELAVHELDERDPAAIAARVSAGARDVLALSCYVWSATPLLMAAARLRHAHPDLVVIAGGPELAGVEEEVLAREPALDAVVHGEGEETFRAVLEALVQAPASERRAALAGVPGLSFRAGGRVETARMRPPIAELDALPSPYLDGTYFRRRAGRLDGHWAVVAQYRGCPYRCAYCHWGAGERGLRWFSEERVLSELAAIREAGVADVFFADALFTVRRDRARRILDALATLRFREVTVHVDPDALDDDLIARLAATPGVIAHVGVQSASAETLRHARRDLVVSPATPRLRQLVASGCAVRLQAIVGLPTDTPAQLRATLEPFLGMPPSVDVQLFHLQVLPGSEYWRCGRDLGLAFDSAPPHFAERGLAWSAADLGRMKLDAWLVAALHCRNALRMLDRLFRSWAPASRPLLWCVADRLWEAGAFHDLPHGAFETADALARSRVLDEARAVVAALPPARAPGGAAQLEDAAALDAAIGAFSGDAQLRRRSLRIHPSRTSAPADDDGAAAHVAVVALRGALDVFDPRAEAVRLRVSPGVLDVVPVGRAELERPPASPRADAPGAVLLVRLPPRGDGGGAASSCNNGCEVCVSRRDPEVGSGFDADVNGRHVWIRDREPLMRRELPGLVAALRARGATSIRVVTNGRLLVYGSLAASLVRAGVDELVVKLFGRDAATHDAHTRAPGSFGQACRGIATVRALGGRVVATFPGAPVASDAAARVVVARELTGGDPVDLPAG